MANDIRLKIRLMRMRPNENRRAPNFYSKINKYVKISLIIFLIFITWKGVKFVNNSNNANKNNSFTKYEINKLNYFLKKKKKIFEFGNNEKIFIEYNRKVSKNDKIKPDNLKSHYIHVYLENNELIDDNKIKNYIQAYDKKYEADIILINGKYKVACALDIFDKITQNTLIVIDSDQNFKKDENKEILNYFNKIEDWDSLIVFNKKQDIKLIPINIYNKYLNSYY